MSSAFEKMDRMYRHQRYFYDFTRKYYLLGRDKLISEMDIQPYENVLEIGCGTGRNLMILAQKHPNADFYGLDASAAMLETAGAKARGKNLHNIRFESALADNFSFDSTFGLGEPFDTIFFSYSISMIPTWREAVRSALDNLKRGQSLYIVDFYDQRDLPKRFRQVLKIWLKQFHVKYHEALIPYLEELETRQIGKLSVMPIYRSYSFIIRFKKL